MNAPRKDIKYRRVAKLLEGPWPKTKLVDQYEPAVRDFLLAFASEEDIGEPIAAFYGDSKTWTILTTTHLAWSRPEDGPHALSFQRIRYTDFHPADVRKISEDPSHKRRLDRIQLTSVDGQTWTVPLEPRAPYSLFWSAIKQLAETKFGLRNG